MKKPEEEKTKIQWSALLVVGGPGSLLFAITYELGFFLPLNIELIRFFSLNDFIKSSLIYLPFFLCAVLLALFNEAVTVRIERGLSEEEILELSPNPDRLRFHRNLPSRVFFWIVLVSAIFHILFLLPKVPFYIPIILAAVLLYVRAIGWIFQEHRIADRFSIIDKRIILFAPCFFMFAFGYGYQNSTLLVSDIGHSRSSYVVSMSQEEGGDIMVRHTESGSLTYRHGSGFYFTEHGQPSATFHWPMPEHDTKSLACRWVSVLCIGHAETEMPSTTQSTTTHAE